MGNGAVDDEAVAHSSGKGRATDRQTTGQAREEPANGTMPHSEGMPGRALAAVAELISSEENYTDSLHRLMDIYYKPLRDSQFKLQVGSPPPSPHGRITRSSHTRLPLSLARPLLSETGAFSRLTT